MCFFALGKEDQLYPRRGVAIMIAVSPALYFSVSRKAIVQIEIIDCAFTPSIILFLQKMDFRMRTLKENKNNYNSLVQLQRPMDPSFAHSLTHSVSRKNLHEQQPGNESFEGFKAPNWQNAPALQGINQRIGQLEQRVDRIYLEAMGLSQKGDLGKEARNSLSFQSSSEQQENSLFRQGVMANLATQKQEMQSHGARCEEMEVRQARLEQRLRDWMAGQKQELSFRLHTQTEELKGAELSKIKRYDYQYDNIKNIIHELQLKLETDLEYKFKALSAFKQDFSHSISGLREEIGREIGQNKEGLVSFVREIKESFQSLKEALSKDRQNVKQAIFELQSNGQSTATKAQKGLENASRTFAEKHEKLQKKISNFREEWNTFKTITSQQLEEYKEIVVNVEANILENIEGKKSSGDGGNSEEIKEEFSEWRKLTEQKNLNIFREITNAIKVQRLQWRKEHDEMQASMQENLKSVKQIKSSLSKKIDKSIAQQSILLKESLEGMSHRLQEGRQVADSLKSQLQEKLASSSMKLSENMEKQLGQVKKQLQSSLKEMQSKQQVSRQSQQDITSEMRKQLTSIRVHLDTQLESLAKSIAEDNEQWQLQLKASEKKLKETISKQIEDSASGRQQAVEAKNKQMQESLLAVKKYAQKGLIDERNETVKQIMKVTEELTSLVNDWSSKGKKERETLENSVKEQLLEAKKSSAKASEQVKAVTEDLKKKAQQKQAEDERKSSQLKSWVESTITKTSKSSEEDSKTVGKKIDALKAEMQGRLKASIDKLLLEINSKKQLQAKAKEEEKTKSLEQEKKLGELYTKLKGEFGAQISKTSKLIEDQSAKSSKKSQALAGSLKKDMQGELEKQRKYCMEQLAKLKGELELKLKAKEEKAVAEQSSKREAEVKQKEEQFKAKLAEVDKKLIDSLSKLKTELIGELGKSKTVQAEEIGKVKKQFEQKVKAMEEQKDKKEAESRGKQQQFKEKEKELKDRSAELDAKLESAKKDTQKMLNEEITKAKAQINQKVQKSAIQSRSAAEKQLQAVNKSRQDQAQKKLQELRVQTDKKIAQLKGVSLTSMKAQEEQAKKAQDQRLAAVRAELLKLIQASNSKIKQSTEGSSKLALASEHKFSQLWSLLKGHEALINKLEAGLFADRQKHKAVYDKMTTDLLDIADSITLVLTEMKPAEK